MKYYLDLFSPETAKSFRASDQCISGFRARQRGVAQRVKPGDRFLCYLTRLSRWLGIMEVIEGPFEDSTPIFYPESDPFVVRFKVRVLVLLELENAIPIHDERIWTTLSFTKGCKHTTSMWTGKLRASLNELSDQDGSFIENELLKQLEHKIGHPLTESDIRKLKTHRVRTAGNQEIEVVVPETDDEEQQDTSSIRESSKVQARLCQIGERMGYHIWIPRNDRTKVLSLWKPEPDILLDHLPLNYDETTLSTIEQIDVIWLRGRSIIRAFEVEHTTSIYSGILRMADLMALQPNMDIKAHIVAPDERREKVLQEIKRPVFSLLEKGPLANSCSYLSYESVDSLCRERLVHHMTDSVLEEFAEYSEV